MSRFILRYAASQPAPADSVASIHAAPGIKVIDQSPNMLLVDGEESALRAKMRHLPGWTLHSETGYELPDTRKKIE